MSETSVFPMLLLVPARSRSEAEPLFLKTIGEDTVLGRTAADAERQQRRGDVSLVLTTDDPRLKEHIEQRDASWLVRMREQPEIDGGYFEALEAAGKWASEQLARDFASVLILEPSHPFRPANLIGNAIEIMERDPALDTVVAVVREYGNLWTEDQDGVLKPIQTPEGRTFYRELAGLGLLTRPEYLTRTGAGGPNVGFVVVKEQWALIDIHGPEAIAAAQRFHGMLTREDS